MVKKNIENWRRRQHNNNGEEEEEKAIKFQIIYLKFFSINIQ
jgi:hypothetical protein